MRLDKLILNNYRNLEDFEARLGQRLTLITGGNARGKTNVIEAVRLVSTGSSHRTNDLAGILRWGSDCLQVQADAWARDRRLRIDLWLFSDGRKQGKINGREFQRLSSLSGHLASVFFSPDDLRIVKEGPELRRGFLDDLLGQLKPRFAHDRRQYTKVLRQRNALLKQQRIGLSKAAIEPWNEQLKELGSRLTVQRVRLVHRMGAIVDRIHRRLAGGGLTPRYACRLPMSQSLYEEILDGDIGSAAREVGAVFEGELARRRQDERDRGVSLVGPHRDDLQLFEHNGSAEAKWGPDCGGPSEGTDVRTFGSQGEQRTAVLALKLTELEILREDLGEWPLLLLDDVMSELDETRRTMLMAAIADGAQGILTSTNRSYFREEELAEAVVIDMG